MGRDKAALGHPDGRTLARRSCDLLEEAGCDEVFLSLRTEQEIPPGFSGRAPLVIRDGEGEGGPVAGMLAAMRSRPDADWLVVACDLPRLDAATLRNLLDERTEEDLFLAYRSESDDLPEPLCAWYAAEAGEVIAASGLNCPRKILIRNGCRLLEPRTLRALENANTPEDWEASLKA